MIDLVIRPRERDLGEFTVRRVLPAPRRRAVGPFVFFDHMGPAEFPPGKGIAVRPHPHIGIATITARILGRRARATKTPPTQMPIVRAATPVISAIAMLLP